MRVRKKVLLSLFPAAFFTTLWLFEKNAVLGYARKFPAGMVFSLSGGGRLVPRICFALFWRARKRERGREREAERKVERINVEG